MIQWTLVLFLNGFKLTSADVNANEITTPTKDGILISSEIGDAIGGRINAHYPAVLSVLKYNSQEDVSFFYLFVLVFYF